MILGGLGAYGAGILGLHEGHGSVNIVQCFNSGDVSLYEHEENTGKCYGAGIVNVFGYNNFATVSSCYNTGSITTSYNKAGIVNVISGDAFSSTENCYYLDTSCDAGIIEEGKTPDTTGAKTATEMKQQDFVDLLNSNISEGILPYKLDTNGGYPIF